MAYNGFVVQDLGNFIWGGYKALILVYTMGRGPGTIGSQLLSERLCSYEVSFLRMYLGNRILR